MPAALAGVVATAALASPTGPAPARVDLPHIQTVASDRIDRNIVANFNTGDNNRYADIYDQVIGQIRQRVRAGTLREGLIRETSTTDYFAVHFQAGSGTPQVSVVFNAANLYVVGYYNHDNNTYVRMGAGPWNPVGAATVRNDFLRQGDYLYLERQAADPQTTFDRANQALTLGALNSAIRTLANTNALGAVPGTQSRSQARAILTVIQMFAEGARFDFISANIGSHMRNGVGFTAGTRIQVRGDGGTGGQMAPTQPVSAVDWENVWGRLSQYILDRLNNGGAFNFAVGALRLTTMQAAANQVAVVHISG